MPISALIVHLVAVPDTAKTAGPRTTIALTKAAPYFQPFDTEVVELGHEQLTLGSESAQVTYELIDGSIKVAEARWTLEDVAAPTGPARRAAVQAALRARVAVSDSPDTLVEEYVWAPGDSPTAVCVRRSK